MREACFNEIVNQARTNDKIWLVTADMGYGLVDAFAQEFPDRYINVGVAEQNMIGVAAGLALSGKVVFCYSIGVFPTLRCLEQIRNDVCYHNLNVNIIAGGTGLTYGPLGFTHHAIEDIAVMRVLPNMTVLAPSTKEEARLMIEKESCTTQPSYIRLGISNASEDSYLTHGCRLSDYSVVPKGSVAILPTGSMLGLAMGVADKLTSSGISCHLRRLDRIKPIDTLHLRRTTVTTNTVVTIEEHRIVGGLGSIVSEVLSELGNCPRIIHAGVDDMSVIHESHSRDELLKINGLTVDAISSRVFDAQ